MALPYITPNELNKAVTYLEHKIEEGGGGTTGGSGLTWYKMTVTPLEGQRWGLNYPPTDEAWYAYFGVCANDAMTSLPIYDSKSGEYIQFSLDELNGELSFRDVHNSYSAFLLGGFGVKIIGFYRVSEGKAMDIGDPDTSDRIFGVYTLNGEIFNDLDPWPNNGDGTSLSNVVFEQVDESEIGVGINMEPIDYISGTDIFGNENDNENPDENPGE